MLRLLAKVCFLNYTMGDLDISSGRDEWKDFPDSPGEPSEGLFGMTKQEMRKLQQSVRDAGNAITIIVHPYYHDIPDFEARVEEFIRKPVHGDGAPTTPVFVFEESQDVMHTDGRLYGEARHTPIYIVPTEFATGTPSVRGMTGPKAWDIVIDILHRLQVRKIYIGGMEYYGTHKKDDGCVDEVIAALTGKFDITVTSLVYPEPIPPKRRGGFFRRSQ